MTGPYLRTGTVLDRILAHKVAEVAARKVRVSAAVQRAAAEAASPPRDMRAAVRRATVALIAEVKHASPSRGVLVEGFDPVTLATTYARHGAAAISVLTEAEFFQGKLADLVAVRHMVDVPVLRKDFVLDTYQVYEARAAGADAVLLIVAALDDAPLADLHALVVDLGMTALVEVHNEAELARALRLSPSLLGINNRDLRTFNVDLATTARLAAQVPGDVTLVAESGVFTGADVRRMGQMGAHAVLVGEALVTAADRPALVRELSSQPREAGS
jgi:indole-3-glycerol phosphate synthase